MNLENSYSAMTADERGSPDEETHGLSSFDYSQEEEYNSGIDVAVSSDMLEHVMEPVDPEGEFYRQHLEDHPTDFEVPVHRGEILDKFNGGYLPNIEVRDVRQESRFDLSNKSPEAVSKIIGSRIRDGVTGMEDNQVRSFRFYQVPAPIEEDNGHDREEEYIRELFVAQNKLYEDESLVRKPEILLESGDQDTILGDPEDARRVREHYEELRSEFYTPFRFLVDFNLSEEPERIIDELGLSNIGKLRGVREDLERMRAYDENLDSITMYDN